MNTPTLDLPALCERVDALVEEWVIGAGVKRLLLLPPDHTRLHSFAGPITRRIMTTVGDRAEVFAMPALGTHFRMRDDQLRLMFGDDAPLNRFLPHDWRNDLEPLGQIPASRLAELSDGQVEMPVEVAVNRRIVSGEFDLVLSIGQVVPHEVIGFANHTKNVCIGAGGGDMIHKSHYLGAVCGIERILGQADTPVRRLVDQAFYEHVRPRADVRFLLTVVDGRGSEPRLAGFFSGEDSDCFHEAAALSAELNLTKVDRPLDRCVVCLDPREFSSTWLGNKGVYRTRKAIADGGELILLAPGLETFGEDPEIDRLIREHGYRGTPATLAAVASDASLSANLSAAAHLIHGASEGRFRIRYCPGKGLDRDAIESVGYESGDLQDVQKQLGIDPLALEGLSDGWREETAGEPFYLIRNPALGLWSI